jgi:ComF family protein
MPRVFNAFNAVAQRLPSCCKVCRRWGAALVCEDCLQQFAPLRHRCRTCAVGLLNSSQERCGGCLSIGTPLDACHAAVDYAYPWDGLLQRFKYSDGGDLRAQPELAHSMACVARYVAQRDSTFAQALEAANKSDWLIPMALHPMRQRQRGFDQSHVFAKALLPGHPRLRTDLLLRIKNTAVQASLARDAREFNVRGAFITSPLSAQDLKDCSITLIDDVTTTQSTLCAAARVLRRAGAREVNALVFARAK